MHWTKCLEFEILLSEWTNVREWNKRDCVELIVARLLAAIFILESLNCRTEVENGKEWVLDTCMTLVTVTRARRWRSSNDIIIELIMRRSESAAFGGLVQPQCCEMQGRSGVVLLSVCTAIRLSKMELATPHHSLGLRFNKPTHPRDNLAWWAIWLYPSRIERMTTWLKATRSRTNLTFNLISFLEEPSKFWRSKCVKSWHSKDLYYLAYIYLGPTKKSTCFS